MTSVSIDFSAGKLTAEGKKRVAHTLFEKGKSFLRASAHLRKEEGYEFVILHLLCQGMEITLKAYLLYADYDKYSTQLKAIGHDLEKLAKICSTEYQISVGRKELLDELSKLNALYLNHILRYGYGSVLDILEDPKTIRSGRVGWRLIASVRLANYLLGISRGAIN